jgi:transposase-like protein
VPEVRRRFDQDFRDGVVRIVKESGKPIAQVAVVWESTRRRWRTGVARDRAGQAPGPIAPGPVASRHVPSIVNVRFE